MRAWMRRVGAVASVAMAFAAGAAPRLSADAALDRLAAAMGGDALLTLRTLVVSSQVRRTTDLGTVDVPTRTSYAFPYAVRHEVTLLGRTIAMSSAPSAGALFTDDGVQPLDDAGRVRVEQATMRNPVVLVKARLGRGFAAEAVGTESVDGKEADRVDVRQHGHRTTLLVDREDGRLLALRYDLASPGGAQRRMTVRFDDWRRLPSGLVYPFAASGEEDGRRVFDVRVQEVATDVAIDETQFTGGLGHAGHGSPGGGQPRP